MKRRKSHSLLRLFSKVDSMIDKAGAGINLPAGQGNADPQQIALWILSLGEYHF